MAEHNDLGKAGEELAIAHLQKLGYKIRLTNYSIGKAEIDIIAEDGEYIVFVEVKTRKSDVHENPIETVTPRKRKMMIAAADFYINERGLENECRFDIIAVIKNGNKFSLEHITDAFSGITE
jgi:putative endonuclease